MGAIDDAPETSRLIEVTLDEKSIARSSPDVDHERKVAIFDLLEENVFVLDGQPAGPYRLTLSMAENRLVFAVCDEDANPITLMSKGVRRDVTAQYSAGVRYDDAMSLEIDGEPKARGTKFKGTKRVPPGMVMQFDRNKALRKKSIHEAGSKAPSWGDGKELIDDSGWIFAVETSLFMAVMNRKLFSYWEGQTEI